LDIHPEVSLAIYRWRDWDAHFEPHFRGCPAVFGILKYQEVGIEAVLEICRAEFGWGISISNSYLPCNSVAVESDEIAWEGGQAIGPVIAGIIPG
jgi:hypothetical protein